MTGTTTIEIRDDQQEALSDLKQHDRESYKAVLDRLLGDVDPTEPVPIEDVVREIPIARLEDRLDRNYDAIQEATNAAHSAANEVGELQR